MTYSYSENIFETQTSDHASKEDGQLCGYFRFLRDCVARNS